MFEKRQALENQIQLEQDAFQRIDLQITLAWELAVLDLEAMDDVIQSMERDLKTIDYVKGHAYWLGLKALYAAKKDHYIEALECADMAFDTFISLGDVEGQIRMLRILSLIYALIGKYEESIDICFKGLALIEEHHISVLEENNTLINFTFLNNLSANCSNLGRYGESIDFQLKAYDYIKNTKKGSTHVLALANLSQGYRDIDNLELALDYGHQGLELAQSLKLGSYYFHLCYLALGQVYHKMGFYEKAAENLNKSLDEIGASKYGQAEVLISLGKLHYEAGHLPLATEAFKKAIELAEEIKTFEYQREGHEWLAKCYEVIGDYSSAVDHYKLNIELNREMTQAELSEKLEKYTADFIVEQAKRDAEIYKLRNVELKEKNDQIDIKAKELEASHQKISTLSLIGKQITASLDIEKVLETIYSSVITLMDASIFGIGTYNEKTGIIDYKMFIEESIRLPVIQTSIEDSTSFAARCIKMREAIVDNNTSNIQSVKRSIKGNGTNGNKKPESLIYYPLILGETVIGVITVQSYRANAYTEIHLDAIKILASYIAIALNNSQQSEALQKAVRELEVFSKTDPLTELYNRRYISEKISEECERYKRSAHKFSVIIADIDFFKNVNDAYGHDCGDFILKELSELLKLHLRKQDHLARWGGEEFLILLTETDICSGAAMAERLRKIIMNTVFTYLGQSIQMTLTFGIAEYHEEPTIEETIRRADRALYHGKGTGRNKCIIGGIHHCQLPHVEEILG